MRSFLEIINGRYAGTTEPVGPGQVCTVGRAFGADLFLPPDDLLEPLHLMVKNEDEKVFLEKLSGDVFVNNQPFGKGEIVHGDSIFAGKTLFRLTMEGGKPFKETVLDKLIAHLSGIKKLGLLIDENLDRSILPILQERKATFRQLKKTEGFEALTANPLLVRMNGKPRLLEILVRSFWGKGLLVFFEPKADLTKTTGYFQFLLAKTQIKPGADLRFYDARVLRVALSEADPQSAGYLFGAAEKFFVESQLPSHLFEFAFENEKVTANLIRLSEAIS